jgi:hypothetical protein
MEQHCVEFFQKRAGEKRGAPLSKEDVQECFQELDAKRQKMMREMMEKNSDDAPWTQAKI